MEHKKTLTFFSEQIEIEKIRYWKFKKISYLVVYLVTLHFEVPGKLYHTKTFVCLYDKIIKCRYAKYMFRKKSHNTWKTAQVLFIVYILYNFVRCFPKLFLANIFLQTFCLKLVDTLNYISKSTHYCKFSNKYNYKYPQQYVNSQ